MWTDHKGTLILSAALFGGGLAVWGVARARRSRPTQAQQTDFEAYLQKRIENPSLRHQNGHSTSVADHKDSGKHAATSFEAYLKQPHLADAGDGAGSGGGDGQTTKTSEVACDTTEHEESVEEHTVIPPDVKPVTVIYGTEFGFSREIAEMLCERLKETQALWPELIDMADYPEGLPLDAAQAVLMVCSTQGDGVAPTEATEFCAWLLSNRAPMLTGTVYSVCALGDKSYAHFCRCGKTLDARLKALGAKRMVSRVDVDKEDWNAIEKWMSAVTIRLQEASAADLKTVEQLQGKAGVLSSFSGGKNDNNSAVPSSTANGLVGPHAGAPSSSSNSKAKGWSKARPYYAKVAAVEPLCSTAISTVDGDKCTMRIQIDLEHSGLRYVPGDALGVWPTNDPDAVDCIVRAMKATGEEQVRVPTWHYVDDALFSKEKEKAEENGDDGIATNSVAAATTMSFREALSRCYDLKQPKQSLLRLLLDASRALEQRIVSSGGRSGGDGANSTTTALKRSEQQEEDICANGCVVDAADRLASLLRNATSASTYLANRHVIDILREFAAATSCITPPQLLSTLRQLAPRLYSISSSPLQDPRRVEITVAVVKYRVFEEERKGVCSTYVGERIKPGDRVPVYVYPNPDFRLPLSDKVPIVMVGPGTGVAPFRAFIQDRLLRAVPAAAVAAATSTVAAHGRENWKGIEIEIVKDGADGADKHAVENVEEKKKGQLGDEDAVRASQPAPPHAFADTSSSTLHDGLSDHRDQNGVSHDDNKDDASFPTSFPVPTHADVSATLFFGCRHRDQDFLYRHELESWAQRGCIDLCTAFSREQSGKVYVQDRLIEHGDKVWHLLEHGKGHFYICGDGQSMAGAVETALVRIAASRLNGSEQDGVRWLNALKAEKRFQKDVW
jgi:sulfite reductase alpha subunit-like flavoprotein